MICPNCQGECVFKDIRCFCQDFEGNPPDPRCNNCHGQGRYDSPCPLCEGKGEVPDRYEFRFVNDETGRAEVLTIDANNLPPLRLRERPNSAYPDKTDRTWSVPIDQLFTELCQRLNVSEQTHFLYHEGSPVEFGWDFGSCLAGSNRAGWDPDPTEQELTKNAKRAIASHFGWYVKAGRILVWHLKRRQSTEELLEKLYQIVLAKRFAYDIRMWEGNIATGESGWSIFLTSEESELAYAELSVAYTLAVALQGAIERAPEAMSEISLFQPEKN